MKGCYVVEIKTIIFDSEKEFRNYLTQNQTNIENIKNNFNNDEYQNIDNEELLKKIFLTSKSDNSKFIPIYFIFFSII